jgi:dnd system-associated protein 4
MADIRIKVAKDKAKLVKEMRAGEGSTGPFQTYYEVIAFAAALGIQQKAFHPFSEAEASKEIDPIRQEQFASKGYDQLIGLVSVIHNKNPKVLGNNEVSERNKVEIFEGYANGGLGVLSDMLRGSENHGIQILLLLSSFRKNTHQNINDDILELDFL